MTEPTDDAAELTAYHEAGHAFMAILLGGKVRSITIEPDWDEGPRRYGDAQIEWRLGGLTQRELCEKSILVALAGPVAEMIHCGEPLHPGFVAQWKADWQEAWKLAAALHPQEQRRLRYLEQVTAQLGKMLERDEHWAALAAIVDELLAHETLDGEQIEEAVAIWLSRRQ